MSQVDDLKKLVKEARKEVDEHGSPKGTCMNPSRFLFWVSERHNFTKWRFRNVVDVYANDDAKRPIRREALYNRKCRLCGKMETDKVDVV